MYVPALIKTTAPRPRVRRQLQKLMRRRNQIIGDGKNSLWSLIILPAHLVMASMRHRESERSAHTHTRESDTSQIQFPPYLKGHFLQCRRWELHITDSWWHRRAILRKCHTYAGPLSGRSGVRENMRKSHWFVDMGPGNLYHELCWEV